MAQTIVLDRRLEALVDPAAEAERIATGFTFTEGPVWDRRDAALYFSDIQGDTIYRWREGEGHRAFRRPSGQANGNTIDAAGRLVTCEHANRRVTRTEAGGSVSVLADRFEGKRLNSPNDVVFAPNGDLYFTDPPYGLRQPDGSFAPQEVDFCGVYRLSAGGELSAVVRDCERPNGLVVTADGRTLLVADTQRAHVRRFRIEADGALAGGEVFVEVVHDGARGLPDGMKLDSLGNLYVTANTAHGVWVFAADGALLGFIGVPEAPANCAWGGPELRTFFVTARTSVYRLPMRVAGQGPAG
jgi:gluconolactonase